MEGSASPDSGKKMGPLLPTEEKELRRVFDRLCDYQVKSRINEEIKDLQAWQQSARTRIRESVANNILVDQNHVETTHTATQSRIDELKQQLHELETNSLKSISPNDVSEMFKYLGVQMGKREIDEMIWEVDEDLNGRIDWNEFRLMYVRNVNDKTGLEPSRIVSMVLIAIIWT
jgi:EF-hand domain pair